MTQSFASFSIVAIAVLSFVSRVWFDSLCGRGCLLLASLLSARWIVPRRSQGCELGMCVQLCYLRPFIPSAIRCLPLLWLICVGNSHLIVWIYAFFFPILLPLSYLLSSFPSPLSFLFSSFHAFVSYSIRYSSLSNFLPFLSSLYLPILRSVARLPPSVPLSLLFLLFSPLSSLLITIFHWPCRTRLLQTLWHLSTQVDNNAAANPAPQPDCLTVTLPILTIRSSLSAS